MLRETQDLVVRSLDFRMEKSALECPLWIVVLHLRYNKKKKKKGKIGDQFVKPKIWKSNENWVGDKKQSACGWCGFKKLLIFNFFLSTLAFLSSASMKLKGTKIRKKKEKKTYYVHMLFRKM